MLQQDTQKQVLMLAEKKVALIEGVLNPLEKVPESIALMLESGYVEKDSITVLLKEMLAGNKNIYGSTIAFEPYFIDSTQKYFAPYVWFDGDSLKTMQLGTDEYDYFSKEWYKMPAELKKSYWAEPYFDEGGGNIIMSTYSVPFYCKREGKKRFAGIVTIDIDLNQLSELLEHVKILETGFAFLISPNGVIMAHPNKEYIMKKTIYDISRERNSNELYHIALDMVAGKTDLRNFDLDDTQKHTIYFTTVISNNWSLGVVYNNSEMYAPLIKNTIILCVIILCAILILILIIIQIAKRITQPLKSFTKSVKSIAEGNFHTELPEIETHDEMLELRNSFAFMQESLIEHIKKIKETTAAKESYESQLRIAHSIQMGMIPKRGEHCIDYHGVQICGTMIPAKEVGGDLFNYFMIDDDHLGFTIGDVSDKGIPAALFMAMTNILIKSIASTGISPADVLRKTNEELCKENDQFMFVTLFFGKLNIKTGIVDYANAGHNPFILSKKGDIHYQSIQAGMVLAAFEDTCFTNETIILEKGDTLYMYTDGVTEAMNNEKTLYGEQRLLDFVKQSAELSISEIIENTISSIEEFAEGHEQSDDITVLVLRYS